jgi:hypothetical protein
VRAIAPKARGNAAAHAREELNKKNQLHGWFFYFYPAG